MMNSLRPAIEVSGLHVSRSSRPVLHGLDFPVAAGAVTGLLGPSGCGKTTFLRAVVGLQRLDRGSITVFGLPAGSPALRTRIGYVTQSPSVYGDLSVRDNLRYFAAVLGAPAARIDAVLRDVGLADRAGQVVDTLSGGQRARVSLATALLNEPELLVLDEPTVGLDPVLRRDLWELFHRLAANGSTLVVSSHVMDEAARCDHLLLMRDGRLVANETPDALRAQTATDDLEAAFLVLAEAAGVAA